MDKVAERIAQASSVALFTHIRPDGDALGSVLALQAALKSIGKSVTVYCDSPVPARLAFLSGADKILSQGTPIADLFVALDCGDADRLGCFSSVFLKKRNTCNVDHHLSNTRFAACNYVKGTSSTCELVLQCLRTLKIELTEEIATLLYVGLSTDTGNFSHSNTTAETFACAATLTACGVKIDELNRRLYKENPYRRLKLLGKVLSGMRSYEEGKIIVLTITSQDLASVGCSLDQTEAFVDYAISVDTAEVGIAVCEQKPNTYKVSMRSRGKADVCRACGTFGGGGHRLASGCTVCGFFEDVVEKVVKSARDEL